MLEKVVDYCGSLLACCAYDDEEFRHDGRREDALWSQLDGIGIDHWHRLTTVPFEIFILGNQPMFN